MTSREANTVQRQSYEITSAEDLDGAHRRPLWRDVLDAVLFCGGWLAVGWVIGASF